VLLVDEGVSDARIVGEIAARGRPDTVIVHANGASAERIVPAEIRVGPLPDRPVVLATGGASGIVAACVAAIPGARVALLGRRSDADVPANAMYLACDVTDADAVAVAVARVRAELGRIDVVVHGAGVVRDRSAADLDEDDVTAVLAPKLAGAEALFAATADDHPALWLAFSSLAAVTGNVGQAAYAGANAVLDGLVHPTAARSVSIGWSAWSKVGMAAAIERLLRARGVAPIEPAAGVAAFCDLLATGDGDTGHVHALIAAQPLAEPLPWPLLSLRSGRSVAIRLDPSDPALADHRVGGRPLVPAALWIRAMHAALGVIAGPGSWRLGDVAILAPTFVERPRTDVVVRIVPDGSGWRLTIAAGAVDLCVATAESAPGGAVRAAPSAASTGDAAELYRADLLFHGPSWRVLDRVSAENGVASALLAAGTVDPTAAIVDAAHQLLSAWSGARTGWLCVPIGATSWWFAAHDVVATRVVVHAKAADSGVTGSVVAYDAEDHPVAVGEGVRLRRAAPWPADLPVPVALRGE
jgi:NAD(P)-dependent dehydrogenase (short-subunit alcohol dehydrogenase family)